MLKISIFYSMMNVKDMGRLWPASNRQVQATESPDVMAHIQLVYNCIQEPVGNPEPFS